MHADTETRQFGDQAHTAVCINVSLFISYHCTLYSDDCQTLDTHDSHNVRYKAAHYSIKVSKKRSIVSLSDSMINLSA